jgi:hypothetical protein
VLRSDKSDTALFAPAAPPPARRAAAVERGRRPAGPLGAGVPQGPPQLPAVLRGAAGGRREGPVSALRAHPASLQLHGGDDPRWEARGRRGRARTDCDALRRCFALSRHVPPPSRPVELPPRARSRCRLGTSLIKNLIFSPSKLFGAESLRVSSVE